MKLRKLHEEIGKEKIKNLIDLLDPSDRVFFTNNKYDGFKEPSVLGARDKPGWGRGSSTTCLWYAFGGEWVEYGILEYDYQYSMLYEINVDTSKLIILRSEDDLNNFNNKYGLLDMERDYLAETKEQLTRSLFVEFKEMRPARLKYNGGKNVSDLSDNDFTAVAWDIVRDDGYGGIELPIYGNVRSSLGWNYSWDVSSGAIWDASVIKNVELILGPDDLEG